MFADVCSCMRLLHPDLTQRVSADTLLKYQKRFSAFTDFLQTQLGLEVLASNDLDNLLMDYRTEMELTRFQLVMLVASAEFFLPHMKSQLHLSRETLRGKASAEPTRHTVPLTAECAFLFETWRCRRKTSGWCSSVPATCHRT